MPRKAINSPTRQRLSAEALRNLLGLALKIDLGKKMCQRLSFSLLDVINSTLELGSNEAEIKFKTALGKKTSSLG